MSDGTGWRSDVRGHPVAAVIATIAALSWLVSWFDPVRDIIGTVPSTTSGLLAPIIALGAVWVIRGWSTAAVATWLVPLAITAIAGYLAPQPLATVIFLLVALAIVGLAVSSRVIATWSGISWRLLAGPAARRFDARLAAIVDEAHRSIATHAADLTPDATMDPLRRVRLQIRDLEPPSPAWDRARSALADYVDTLAGLRQAAPDLDEDLRRLVTDRRAVYEVARESARLRALRQREPDDA